MVFADTGLISFWASGLGAGSGGSALQERELMARAKKIKPRQWDPLGLVWKYPRNEDTYELLLDEFENDIEDLADMEYIKAELQIRTPKKKSK